MKNIEKFTFLFVVIIQVGCNNKNSIPTENIEVNPKAVVSNDVQIKDTLIAPKELVDFTPIWESDTTDDNYEKIIRSRSLDSIHLTNENILKILNSQMESKCVFDKIKGNTIFIDIPNSVALTQRHGSSGAQMRMKLIVYTLTELPNIKKVHLNFEEGDHASPGTYSRKDFQ
jgi:hypothetical protein